MGDKIEFHHCGRIVALADSSHAPDRGDKLNIRKQTYKVVGRSYTVDLDDDPLERSVVCILNLEECGDND